MKIKLAALAALLTAFAAAKAAEGDGIERRWALDVRLNPIFPTAKTTSSSDYFSEKSAWSGPNAAVHAEYYLPFTRFSITGGYESEVLDFCGGDVSTEMSLLTFGGRFYPCPKTWSIQPYVGASTYWNLGAAHDDGSLSASGSLSYTRDYTIKRPRLSVAPVVGLDLYMFSSIALCVDYGYRLAFDGHANISSEYADVKQNTAVHSSMNRHAISVGLKVTFPFKFTSEDGVGLLNSVLMSLFSSHQSTTRRGIDYY